MTELLVSVGIAYIIGAIVGGGLKAFGIELPVLQTLWRQLALAGFGGVLLGIGIFTPAGTPASTDATPKPTVTPTSVAMPTFTPTPTPTPTPLPTIDDFAGNWFNWNQNHAVRDISSLRITRVNDKNASFRVAIFTPLGSEILPQEGNAGLLYQFDLTAPCMRWP